MSAAIEQLCNPRSSPVVDALAARSIEWFAQWLPAPDDDLDARLRGQLASCMSLFALHDAGGSVGLGAALRHQVAVTYGVAHGDVTCVLLPHVIRFNAPALGDEIAVIARALGVARPETADAEAVARRLEELVAELQLPSRLSQLAESRGDVAALAAGVLNESAAQRNPRPIAEPA
jgi:maleylacetate reductase